MFGTLYVMPNDLVPDKYRSNLLSVPICCKLGFVVYNANLFTANAISSRVALARYWSSLSSRAYELLWLPSVPSELASMIVFGSIGILTGFACSIPSLLRMDSIYCFCKIITLVGFIWISIPTIFAGSPRSVTSHSPCIIPFISDISLTDVVNSNRSSTHTVMISKSPLRCLHTYTHGSERNRRKPCFLTQMSNCIFHSHPDCFSPYRVFTNVQMRGRAASSAAAVCGASGKMASVGGSNGFAGHTRGGSECRQLVIDVHIARFVLATQYNVWSNAT